MNGRVYDYNLGRFLSVDPVIQAPANSQSLNPYSYIMNNPFAGTDPTGYMCTGALTQGACDAGPITPSNGFQPGGSAEMPVSSGKAVGKTGGEIAKTNDNGNEMIAEQTDRQKNDQINLTSIYRDMHAEDLRLVERVLTARERGN